MATIEEAKAAWHSVVNDRYHKAYVKAGSPADPDDKADLYDDAIWSVIADLMTELDGVDILLE